MKASLQKETGFRSFYSLKRFICSSKFTTIPATESATPATSLAASDCSCVLYNCPLPSCRARLAYHTVNGLNSLTISEEMAPKDSVSGLGVHDLCVLVQCCALRIQLPDLSQC